jgi:hypothetical protein
VSFEKEKDIRLLVNKINLLLEMCERCSCVCEFADPLCCECSGYDYVIGCVKCTMKLPEPKVQQSSTVLTQKLRSFHSPRSSQLKSELSPRFSLRILINRSPRQSPRSSCHSPRSPRSPHSPITTSPRFSPRCSGGENSPRYALRVFKNQQQEHQQQEQQFSSDAESEN